MLKIKEFRRKKGFKQFELAAILNIAQSTLSQYEHGDREPNIETLAKIAVVLDVTVDDLIEFKKIQEQIHKELYEKILEKENEPKN